MVCHNITSLFLRPYIKKLLKALLILTHHYTRVSWKKMLVSIKFVQVGRYFFVLCNKQFSFDRSIFLPFIKIVYVLTLSMGVQVVQVRLNGQPLTKPMLRNQHCTKIHFSFYVTSFVLLSTGLFNKLKNNVKSINQFPIHKNLINEQYLFV